MSSALARRFDSLVNFFTGQGVLSRDKALNSFDILDAPMSTTTLQALINGNDIAYRIVTALPNKALKEGFGIAEKDGVLEPGEAQAQAAEIIAALDGLEVREKMLEANSWGRGYGLGGLVLGVDGAGSPQDELEDDSGGRLSWIMVVDRREVVPLSYYADPTSEKFGEVEFYNVVPTGSHGTELMKLHESRLIRFGGALTSRRERLSNSGCDYSVLQRMRQVMRQSDANWASVCALMDDMSQGVYKIKGLMDMIAAGNEATMQSRMTLLDMYRSVRRSIVLDADGEDFERKTTPMTGVNEILEQTWKRVAAAAEMPLTVLMGTSPAGLNATGESDMRLWYDTVRAHQMHVLAPRIERIVRLVSRTLGHANPEAWKVTWPSLWQMTAPEQAAYRYQVAQADQLYIANGTLLPEEVALSRFSSGEDFDGATTTIDADARKKALVQSTERMLAPKPESPAPAPGTDDDATPKEPGTSELLR